QCVFTAEGKQVPIVASDPGPAYEFLATVDIADPAAALVPRPGGVDTMPRAGLKLVHHEVHRLAHPSDLIAQKGQVPGPEEVVTATAYPIGVVDVVPRVGGGVQRLDHNLSRTGVAETQT